MEYAYLDEKRVSAFNCTLKYKELKSKGKAVYKCKMGSDLILKRGLKKIPHFSHTPNSDCICNRWGEKETNAHYYMKIWLQNFLSIPDDKVEYDEIKGVRPDLLWKNKYAIEVQHSPMSIKEFNRRNIIYEANNLIPYWIFHQKENLLFEKKSLNGRYGKFHNKADKIYRLVDIEQHIYDSEESIMYYYFPDEEIFEISSETLKKTLAVKISFDPKIDLFIFNWENDFTLFKLKEKVSIISPELMKFHGNHRFLKLTDQYIKKNELITYLKLRNNSYEENSSIGSDVSISTSGNHITYLKLSYMQKKEIFKDIVEFKKLKHLTINNTGLRKIPIITSNFSQLTELNLSNNNICEINWNLINKLSNLRSLNLSNNKLQEFPDFNKIRSRLKKLNIENNPFHNYTPKWDTLIENAKKSKLEIKRNYLRLVNKEKYIIKKLEGLIHRKLYEIQKNENKQGYFAEKGHIIGINLYETDIKNLPKDIGFLKYLEIFIIKSSSISYLPESFFQLSNLNTLYIEHSLLTEIIDKIKQLKEIKKLSIRHNPIVNLSPEIFSLPELTYLNITNMNIQFPPIKRIKKLIKQGVNVVIEQEKLKKWKIVKEKHIYSSEFKVIKTLEKLIDKKIPIINNFNMNKNGFQIETGHIISLALFNAALDYLPIDFKKLKNLKQLSLSNNNFSRLPPIILKLEKLETLILKNNKLKDLPDEIKKLKNLSGINLENNLFQIFPEILIVHPTIERIFMNNNQISKFNLNIIENIKNVKTKFRIILINHLLPSKIADKIYVQFKELGYIFEDNKSEKKRQEKFVKKKEIKKQKQINKLYKNFKKRLERKKRNYYLNNYKK